MLLHSEAVRLHPPRTTHYVLRYSSRSAVPGTRSALGEGPCSGLTPWRRHMERNTNDSFGNQNPGDATTGAGFGGTGGTGSQAGSQGTNASGTGGFGGSASGNSGTGGYAGASDASFSRD